MSCPLIIAKDKIIDGGFENHESTTSIKIIGGDDTEFIVGEKIDWWLKTRALNLGRYRMKHNLSMLDNRQKFIELYSENYPKNFRELINYIIHKSDVNKLMDEQFAKLQTSIIDLEQCILLKINMLCHKSKTHNIGSLNLSIPELIIPDSLNIEKQYNQKTLVIVINKIAEYINNFKLNNSNEKIELFKQVDDIELIDFNKETYRVNFETITEDDLEKYMDDEIIICKYLKKMETKQYHIIKYLSKLYDRCIKISKIEIGE